MLLLLLLLMVVVVVVVVHRKVSGSKCQPQQETAQRTCLAAAAALTFSSSLLFDFHASCATPHHLTMSHSMAGHRQPPNRSHLLQRLLHLGSEGVGRLAGKGEADDRGRKRRRGGRWRSRCGLRCAVRIEGSRAPNGRAADSVRAWQRCPASRAHRWTDAVRKIGRACEHISHARACEGLTNVHIAHSHS